MCNVVECLSTITGQTLVPDLIELNLSIEEFPEKENSLPDDVRRFVEENEIVEINWVERNTGVFKKIIPTLKKFYGEEYYLLSIDDDYKYREDYVQMMCDYIVAYISDTFCLAGPMIIGNRMIYKSEIFNPCFWEKLTDEVIESRIDDSYVTYYLRWKGAKISGYRPFNVRDIMKNFNPVSPNSHNDVTGQYSSQDICNANQVINKVKF